MTVKIDTDADINSVRLKESAAPATPASGYGQLYAKSDGKIYFKNDAGLEIDLTFTGSASSNPIVLLQEIELSATGTFTFESIPSTYRQLKIYGRFKSNTAATSDDILVQVGTSNVIDTLNNYAYISRWEGNTAATQTAASGTSIRTSVVPADTAAAGHWGIMEVIFDDYASTGTWRQCIFFGGEDEQAAERECSGMGSWRNLSSPINCIKFILTSGGSFISGSKARIYGYI